LIDVQHDAWILRGELLDDIRQHARCERFGASDADFARARISEELDVANALLELVERDRAALEQGTAIHGRLDALGAAVEQPHAQRMLEVGDDLRNGGLRHPELCGRLGHAAALHDREEDMQVAQPQPTADLALPIDFSWHQPMLRGPQSMNYSPIA